MGKGEGAGGVNTSDERGTATFGTSALKKGGKSESRSRKSVTIGTAVKYGGYGTGARTPNRRIGSSQKPP